jgi:hypothetical protein
MTTPPERIILIILVGTTLVCVTAVVLGLPTF